LYGLKGQLLSRIYDLIFISKLAVDKLSTGPATLNIARGTPLSDPTHIPNAKAARAAAIEANTQD